MCWQHPPTLLVLGHASQAHLFAGEAAPPLLLSAVRANPVSIEGSDTCKDLLAAVAL
jgi:hypothetical protein